MTMPEPGAHPAPEPTPTQPAPKKSNWFSLPGVLLIATLLVAGGAAAAWVSVQSTDDKPADLLGSLQVSLKSPSKLDEEFTDADGDLVADAPKDQAKLVNPEKLVFAPLGSDQKALEEAWKDFAAHLTKKTGKPAEVVFKPFDAKADIAELKSGSPHVVCLSTGTVPIAVNTGGFVPLYVMADDGGKFGFQVEFIVPKDSPVKSLNDVKGKRMSFGGLQSHSSFKEPLLLLYEKEKFLPGQDYQFSLGNRQDVAIKGVAANSVEVASVASDLLQRMVAQGDVAKDQVRTIYTHEKSFPPACYGVPYNLHPDLVKKVKEAFETFEFKGTSLEKPFAAANQTKFVPVSYKKDWQTVRDIDESLIKLVSKK